MIREKLASFFNFGDKVLRTDTRYITKGGFWLTLSQILAMFAGFFLSLAFANLFSKENFGNYKFIISMVGVLGIFSLTEMGTAITRSVAKGFGGALKKGFTTNLLWGTGILVGGLGLAVYYFINENYVLSISFVLAAIFLPLTSSASLYNAFLLGKKDFKRMTLYSALRNILPAACLIATLFLTDNLILIMLVYFVSSAVVAFFLYQRTTHVHRSENQEIDPEQTTYSKHLSLIEIIAQASNHIDKILIFHYLGAAPLAIYAFAIAPVEQLQGGKKILSSLILPKISERSFEELQKSGPRKALLLIVYALGIAGIYSLIAPYFYGFFYPQYVDSVIYSQIYSLTLLAVAGMVFDSILVAHGKTKELYTHRTTVSVVKIGLFVVLLPFLGLMGLVISHVITRSFAGILAYYFVKHPYKTQS